MPPLRRDLDVSPAGWRVGIEAASAGLALLDAVQDQVPERFQDILH